MAVKWRGLTWPRKSPKFNLPRLQKGSTGFKMAVQTPKSGITINSNSIQGRTSKFSGGDLLLIF